MKRFNKQQFANILNKINDNYNNQRDFAQATGVNRTYLSRYINMKLVNPPTPKILEKIAEASAEITTYDELMKVCGYYKINRKPIEDEAIQGVEKMIEQQVPGYSILNIVLQYINRLEGK